MRNKFICKNRNQISWDNVLAGFISGFLAVTGVSLLFLEAANNGGFSESVTLSWLFLTYFFAGIFGIILPSYYKIPITGGHSLAGITYIATISAYYSFNELVAGFLISGLFIFFFGISGLFYKLLRILPIEIISSMLAGMILHTLFSLITRFWDATLIVIFSTVGFFLTSFYFKKVPPIFSALLISFITLLFTESLPPIIEVEPTLYFKMYIPDFSIASIFFVGLPLSILILGNDIVVGVNELKKEEYNPEKTNVITFSGLFSIIGSYFGSLCTNLAGVMTSICSASNVGKKEYRYTSSIISGVILLTFAFAARYLVPVILALPKGFPAIITFLTLFSVFIPAFKTSVSNKKYYVYTIPTLLISASNLQIFIINGPILGLIIGISIMSIIKIRSNRKNKRNFLI